MALRRPVDQCSCNTLIWTSGLQMRRREFIAALGSAVAWPLAAHAQQTAKFYHGAYLAFARDQDAAIVKQWLQKLGYAEGNNLILRPAVIQEFEQPVDQLDRKSMHNIASRGSRMMLAGGFVELLQQYRIRITIHISSGSSGKSRISIRQFV
jgi:hypothetical protein